MQMDLYNEVDKLSDECLIFWLPRFILEVRKKSGAEYPPNSLYQLICGIQREVQKTQPQVNFFSCLFSDLNRTLDAEMKRLQSLGLGTKVKKAESISLEEEKL